MKYLSLSKKMNDVLFIPTCTLMIAYCIFYQYIAGLPYLFIVLWILLISFVFQFIGWIIIMLNSPKSKGKERKISNVKNVTEYLVNYSFYIYFFIYLVFQLDRKSVLFNYLILLIFGIYLGYRFAVKSSRECCRGASREGSTTTTTATTTTTTSSRARGRPLGA